jgi:hypothetical protein
VIPFSTIQPIPIVVATIPTVFAITQAEACTGARNGAATSVRSPAQVTVFARLPASFAPKTRAIPSWTHCHTRATPATPSERASVRPYGHLWILDVFMMVFYRLYSSCQSFFFGSSFFRKVKKFLTFMHDFIIYTRSLYSPIAQR